MDQQVDSKLRSIINRIKCPKDFICYKSDFENLCKANDVGQEKYIECLEEQSRQCAFSLTFGNTFLCTCPLRIYATKELNK